MSQEIPEYALNTGWIYDQMKLKWQDLPRKLFFMAEEALKTILFKEQIIAVAWDGNTEYFETKLERLEQREDKIGENHNFPPYSGYFLLPFNEGFNLYNYSNNFHLTKDSYPIYYKLFFLINLLIIDKLQAINFLIFQLNENFNSDIKELNLFLELINLEFEEYLPPSLIDKLITLYNRQDQKILSNSDQNKSHKPGDDGIGNGESIFFKTLAMYYIFNTLNPDGKRTKEAKTRFIAMLINKNRSSIKEVLANPFEQKKPENVRDALLKLIKYFEDLGLNSIVDDINKDLLTIAKKK